jgi:hypothetical protein
MQYACDVKDCPHWEIPHTHVPKTEIIFGTAPEKKIKSHQVMEFPETVTEISVEYFLMAAAKMGGKAGNTLYIREQHGHTKRLLMVYVRELTEEVMV